MHAQRNIKIRPLKLPHNVGNNSNPVDLKIDYINVSDNKEASPSISRYSMGKIYDV
jgi:hypothetical protein